MYSLIHLYSLIYIHDKYWCLFFVYLSLKSGKVWRSQYIIKNYIVYLIFQWIFWVAKYNVNIFPIVNRTHNRGREGSLPSLCHGGLGNRVSLGWHYILIYEKMKIIHLLKCVNRNHDQHKYTVVLLIHNDLW